MPKTTTGFTLVELLIVIVVIGILAAITLVAYNGIQTRAQMSALQADWRTVEGKVEAFNVENGTYPQSITDCPNPSSVDICLTPPSGVTYSYTFYPVTKSGYQVVNTATWGLGVFGDAQVYYKSPALVTGSTEFVQYVDLAPIFDKYGLKSYTLSFDIRSAVSGSVNVYQQNGSNARYSGPAVNVTAGTNWSHQSITFTPALNNAGVTQSMLAFYGTYGSGRIPQVQNLSIQLTQ